MSKSMPVDRSVDWFLTGPGRTIFLQKVFAHCSMYLIKNLKKGGSKGEMLKVVTLNEGLRKKRKKIFVVFAKMTQL